MIKRSIKFISNVFAVLVIALYSCACTEADPYTGLSLALSPAEGQMTVGQTMEISASLSGAADRDVPATYRWMSLNPTVVSLTSDGNRAELTALQGGRAVILVYLEECETVTARATVQVEHQGDGILRILAIGNSFSQDAVEQYLYELFRNDGQEVIIGNMYIGGCDLEKHYNNINADKAAYEYRKVVKGQKTNTKNFKISDALADEKWDYVSIQQASGLSGKYETCSPYLPDILNYVRSHSRSDVKILWHSTWAYASSSNHADFPKYGNDQMTMYNAIVDVARKVMDNPAFGVDILVPSGTAVQNGRTSSLGDTFNRDGYHLETTFGRYTSACTWYEAITGKDVTENSWAPSTVAETKKGIAQNAAHNAVAEPYRVTDMSK
ncbi:MAG: DUF4886 domain-containing protein [Clostridium sp.]|nr:DUF4886 domain-containing protein [Bacteroides sp.]MCM1197349.1 DUF4886 domain-containing protein [Clostridium sp.]